MISPLELVQKLGSQVRRAPEALDKGPFNNIAIDSRKVAPGDLFIALKGEKEDGHHYIQDALSRGARTVLAERVPEGLSIDTPVILVQNTLAALQLAARGWRARHKAQVIGVTGSVGKTTTKELIAAVLAAHYRVLKNEGNLNNEIGLPLTLLELDEGHEMVVLEMGMSALGEISALCEIARPHMGVVTNIGWSHLEHLGSIEAIAQAKGELVEALPADGLALLNGDDERVRALAGRTRAKVTYYGLGPQHDVWAEDRRSCGLRGLSFTLHWQGASRSVATGLQGRHSVYPALAAAAVGLCSGLSLEEVRQTLQGMGGGFRLQVVPGMNGSTIIDDSYNASPASTIAALDFLQEMDGRRIAVLGDMLELGSYEEEGHRQVGRRAAEAAHALLVLGQRGRWIGEEAEARGMTSVEYFGSLEEVSKRLGDILSDDDYVLVKGSRGMAMDGIVQRIKA